VQLSPTELHALVKDCKTASTARAAGVGEELSAGSTFWVPAGGKPATRLERMALRIFEFHSRDASFDPARSGAEWWCQHIDGDDEIGLHWDRDYDMQADQGLLLHPHVASVTYLSESTSGNPTVVLACESPVFASESPCTSVPHAAVCWPAVGRHLCFDGKRLHGAPAGLVPEGVRRLRLERVERLMPRAGHDRPRRVVSRRRVSTRASCCRWAPSPRARASPSSSTAG